MPGSEAQAQPYKVWLIAPDGAVLDISDGEYYLCDVQGLHDLPAREPLASQGYASGSVFFGSRSLPRQFSLTVHIVAGENQAPIRNAAHNAARDALIRSLPEGELVTVRTTYIGNSGLWDIDAFVQQLQWQPGSISYTGTLLAPDPRLRYSVMKQADTYPAVLPNNGLDTVSFTATPGGNVSAHPTVQITPTAAKQSRWNYMREYVVTNPSSAQLTNYPVAVAFDFAGAVAAGKCRADGGDIRVVANNQMIDRWFGNITTSTGRIWVYLDMPPASTVGVQVVYGYAAAPAWVNASAGPMFDLGLSVNAAWTYNGAFMDPPGAPSSRSWPWAVHATQSTGFQPIRQHLPGIAPTFIHWRQSYVQYPTAVNAAGGYVPGAARVQGYVGLALHHPLKIASVVHGGAAQYDPALVKLTLRGYDASTGALTDVWDFAGAIATALRDYGSNITTTFDQPVDAVAFALRSLSAHDIAASPPTIAGADYVEVHFPAGSYPFGNTPPETAIYMLECTVTNVSTGDLVRLNGLITRVASVWQTVQLDFENLTVTMAGEPFYYALDIGPIRADWLKLRPGVANQITVQDVAVQGLEVRVFWRDRRL